MISIGADWYAIAMHAVQEVVSHPVVTEVPTGPDDLLGLINLRGEIVPLFDTAALLGLGPVGSISCGAVVLTRLGLAAFAATGDPEAVHLDEPVSPAEAVGALGTYAVGTRLATLLDVDATLASGSVGGRDRTR
jgi:purine-binding chemotaxis protein CheW